jgi:hypothetical protein
VVLIGSADHLEEQFCPGLGKGNLFPCIQDEQTPALILFHIIV